MKKIWLSIGVILAFGIYAFYQRKSPPSLVSSQVTSSPTSQSSNNSYSRSPSYNYNIPSSSSSGTSSSNSTTSGGTTLYKDGSYNGDSYDAYYGNVQVKVTVSDGKITDVNFLQYPSDRQTSQMINEQAMPILKQEVIKAQSANVNTISGATMTSEAFLQSLQSALSKAA
jgi:uncharacterized protein with FMN-binding domain